MLEKFFISCPIFYANAKPHLGHTYTLCLADAWARYARLRGSPSLKPFTYPNSMTHSRLKTLIGSPPVSTTAPSSFLSVGMDEHGMKVKQAAQAAEKRPRDYCDTIAIQYKALCEANSVEPDDFIRTTEARHQTAVSEFWRRLSQNGHLYEGTYAGWYSVADEAFYTEQHELQLVSSGHRTTRDNSNTNAATTNHLVTATGQPVEWIEEKNFLFRLSSFKPALHKWLDSGVFLVDSPAQSGWLESVHDMVETANDVSLSRPLERLDWGIPVPDRPDQVIYVWLDALVSYLTVCGFPWPEKDSTVPSMWPPTFQLIGKDILRFHAVLWPALLMAVNLPLPRHLICHHHLLADGVKMSKSRGNVVDPFTEQQALTPPPTNTETRVHEWESLRYVLIRSALLSSDASYSRDLAKRVVNTELVNCLGNLLSRITSPRLNPNQSIVHLNREEADALFGQAAPEDAEFLESLDTLASQFDLVWWTQGQPHLAVEHVIHLLRRTNAMLDRHKPWDKNPVQEPEHVIAIAAEALRLAGLLLQPVVPNLSHRLLRRLGVVRADGDTARAPETLFRQLGPDTGSLMQRIL